MAFDKTNMKDKPKKSLGQNFLVDDNFSRKIIDSMNFKKDDIVLEIGSGYGSLTKHIIDKSENIISVELDREISAYLNQTYSQINVINEDFLKVNLKKISESYKGKLRILGNIPYNITSQILFHIFDNREYVQDSLIMMQLELCQRLTAKPKTKDYGILSVFSQIFSEPKLLFKIPPTCFYPKPRVLSGMVYFDLSKDKSEKITNEENFRKVVRTAFGKRRKMLSNSLKDLNLNFNLNEIDFDFNKRPEELTPEDFIFLSGEINRRSNFS
jgi:16S rRNA (adenine1518-N6/adenine1519-N6)-dimethyltransferase